MVFGRGSQIEPPKYKQKSTPGRERVAPKEYESRHRKINYLINKYNTKLEITSKFVRKNPTLNYNQLDDLCQDLLNSFGNSYILMYARQIPPEIASVALSRALYCLSSNTEIRKKQMEIALLAAIDQVALDRLEEIKATTAEQRNQVLKPWREFITCESDKEERKRFTFFLDLFIEHGLRIPKKIVYAQAEKHPGIFRTTRSIEYAIEILRTSCGLIGMLGNRDIFVNPDYLDPVSEIENPKKSPIHYYREFGNRGSQGKYAGHSAA